MRFIKDLKNSLRLNYLLYIIIIVASFIVAFLAVNIYRAPSPSESLIIYSNYLFTSTERDKIEAKLDDSIKSLEIYYDKDIDSTRIGTTGFMMSDIFILKASSIDIIYKEANELFLKLDDSLFKDIGLINKELYKNDNIAFKIPANSSFYKDFSCRDEMYILINNKSSNIASYGDDINHREALDLIRYFVGEE